MQDLIRHLPAVIYEYTIFPDGRRGFTYVSPSSERILGVAADDILADEKVMEALVHEDDIIHLRETSQDSQTTAKEWNWQGRMNIRDTQRWIEINSNHEQHTDGRVIRRGILQDITERRLTAKESEIRYQQIVRKLPIGIFIIVDNRVVFANELAVQLLGAGRSQELYDAEPGFFVEKDARPLTIARLDKVINGEQGAVREVQYVRVDGSRIEVEEIAFPFIFRGKPAVQIIFRDLTDAKFAEAQNRKNETLFTELFNSIPMATVMLDEKGKVKQINEGFRRMFGYELEELQGQNLNDRIVPDNLRNEGIDLNNLIRENRIISVETIRKHKHGHVVNVILYGVPVMQDKEVIGIFGVYVDITDRMKVEDELKIRNAELDNFVYKVSHDLRAPLSSILGLVNLAKVPGNRDDLQEYMHIIGEKVEHLDHFIGDVLSHSKNLKMDVAIGKVELEKIIDDSFKDLNYLQGAREMIKAVSVEGVDFYSDPWRIAEIFRNLVSNAIKYRNMKPSCVPEVRIKAHVDNLRADIVFADNGIGIAEDNLIKVFEMFFRATEQSDGSGIGLYIVRNAIEKLGGQITVTSRQGEGTQFHMIIPNRIASGITRPIPLVFEQRE